MSAETDFVAALLADAGVTALVSDRIAANVIEPKAGLPLIVYTVQETSDNTLLDEGLRQVTFNVECWARTAVGAAELADAVTAAVAAHEAATASLAAWLSNRATAYDPEVGLDSVALTVEWWAQ